MIVIRVVASNTWRLIWRDSLARLELTMLALLALLAAIATVGSPTAGDGAVKMYAIAYSVIPFALVLLIGQMGRDSEDEVAWWARPLSRDQVMWGRFVGYLCVGGSMVGVIAVWGWLLMTALAHLNIGSGAVWTLEFALLTLPSLITVAGTGVWLQTVMPGSTRYYAFAVPASLLIAFVEYKLPLFTPRLPHLAFFNPFPGFLALGLAQPPRLLNPPLINGWLWLNRLVWGLVGLLLLLVAIRRKSRHYALRRTRLTRRIFQLTSLATLVAVAGLWLLARYLSPPVDPGLRLATTTSCRESSADLTLNASTGAMRGFIACTTSTHGVIKFAMNAGLTIFPVSKGATSTGMAPGTAERQWSIKPSGSASRLLLNISGHLLPHPSTLPYPPFAVNQIYSGVYAGSGRIYITHLQQDLPSFLPPSTPVHLNLTKLGPFPVITNATWEPSTRSWLGRLSSLTMTAGPLRKQHRGPVTIWLTRSHILDVRAFLPYVGALRSLGAWLPIPHDIGFIPSPLTTVAIWRLPDIVYSDVHPFVGPRDPMTGSTTAPTNYTASLTLARLFWSTTPTSNNIPANVVLTVLLMYSHSNSTNFQLLMNQVNAGAVSKVGPLTVIQRRIILGEWHRVHRWTPRRQRLWLRAKYLGS